MKTSLITFFCCICIIRIFAQDETVKHHFNAGADVMSRYVWRGTNYGGSPSIQPALEFTTGSLAIGAWGAYTTNALVPSTQEADLYCSYTFADMVSVTVTDYFFPGDTTAHDYFNWGQNTGHILETSLGFSGTEKLPLQLLFAYNIYGDNDNSLYLEAGYSFTLFDFFVGAGNGFYTAEASGNDSFGIVNLGITATKQVRITENFALPVSSTLIINPHAENVFLVFGISI